MVKHRLTEDQLITELNTQLRTDDGYEEGMAFVAYPEGATGREMTGYATKGPFHLTGIYARVAHKVLSKCKLK